jgi:S-adenosylmethionine:tRNA ribosyltransferase-isomerase
MVVSRDGREPVINDFSSLELYLPPKALLVLNDTRVTPARLLGRREDSGGKIELLMLDPPVNQGPGPFECLCLGKPGRILKPGTNLILEKDNLTLKAQVVWADPEGPNRLVRFLFEDTPRLVLESLGHLPLPPYIRRPDRPEDFDRYQTVYAKSPGAVAAPTAGLHFTVKHLETLRRAGFETVTITLTVGAGTFAMPTSEQIREKKLHEEQVEVSEQAVKAVERARNQGRAVVAVGTTVARALEWASLDGKLAAKKGSCSLFIQPGDQFKTVDALLTNFHLPGSSLMYLVGAFLGRQKILSAYALAIDKGMRFCSYGDAMLLL